MCVPCYLLLLILHFASLVCCCLKKQTLNGSDLFSLAEVREKKEGWLLLGDILLRTDDQFSIFSFVICLAFFTLSPRNVTSAIKDSSLQTWLIWWSCAAKRLMVSLNINRCCQLCECFQLFPQSFNLHKMFENLMESWLLLQVSSCQPNPSQLFCNW